MRRRRRSSFAQEPAIAAVHPHRVAQTASNSDPIQEALVSSSTISLPSDAATVSRRRKAEHLFFTGLGVVSSLLLFAGFAPTFYLRPFFRSLDPYTVLPMSSRDGLRPMLWAHGLVFTLWLALFVAQTLLVATRRTPIHRRLGVFGGVIAVAMVVVGFSTAIELAQLLTIRGESADLVGSLFAINLIMFASFATFVVGGLWHRRRPELHKRYMALAMIALVGPGVLRLFLMLGIPPPFPFVFVVLVAFSVTTFDWLSQRRVYSVSLWGPGLLLLQPVLAFSVGALPAWRTFTAWVVHRRFTPECSPGDTEAT
jgi:hypothetical protein